MPKAQLIYFAGRGKTETIRIMLTAAGVEYEETNIESREQFLGLVNDGTLTFGQVPYLKWDGVELVQSDSINRYIAKKCGMMGDNLQEETLIDQYYEGTRDFYAPFLPIVFLSTAAKAKEEAESKTLPKYLPIFEKILGKNGTGYLVGNKFSLSDAGLLETLLAADEYCDVNSFENFPSVQKFLETVNALEFIQKYRTEIRRPQNTPEYVTHVCKVLEWPFKPQI